MLWKPISRGTSIEPTPSNDLTFGAIRRCVQRSEMPNRCIGHRGRPRWHSRDLGHCIMTLLACRNSALVTALAVALAVGIDCFATLPLSAAPDAGFSRWLDGLWPEAQKLGVSRKTFTADDPRPRARPDAARSRSAEPQAGQPQRGQAEFVQTPADYCASNTIARLAGQGKAARRTASRDARQDRAALRRAARHDPCDLGTRDRLRRSQASAQRHPRACDAGLSTGGARSSSATNCCTH